MSWGGFSTGRGFMVQGDQALFKLTREAGRVHRRRSLHSRPHFVPQCGKAFPVYCVERLCLLGGIGTGDRPKFFDRIE